MNIEAATESKIKAGGKHYAATFRTFVKVSQSGIDQTLISLWERINDLKILFLFDADADMAKFTFHNGRSAYLCTSTRRFHRPGKTGKPRSVTVILGGFKTEYEDPENQLIPCDRAGKIDCCYFGMAEDEEDLTVFYIDQLAKKTRLRKNINLLKKSKISTRQGF